jgi:hypothetical protein
MAMPYKFYLKHMASKTAYRANWEPNKPLGLGMVGKLTNGVFDLFTTLEQEGLAMKDLKDETTGEMDYSSSGSVDINIKLAGQAPLAGSVLTEAQAGFVLDFHSDNGVVFLIKDTLTHQISNMGELEKKIVERYKNGTWPKDYVVITQLVEAVSATIIISNNNNNRVELEATANAGLPSIKLTDASLGLKVANERHKTMKVLAQSGIIPIYRVMGIRHPLFGKPALSNREFGATDKELVQEEFQYQDFDINELDQVKEGKEMEQS